MTLERFLDYCREGFIEVRIAADGTIDFIPSVNFPYGNGVANKTAFYDWVFQNQIGLFEAVRRGKHLEATTKTFETFPLLTLQDLAARKPPHWLIEEVMPGHGLSCLYGKPNTGKSFLEVEWALSIAAGESWRGHRVEEGRVIYFAGEGVDTFDHRIQAYFANRKTDATEKVLENFRVVEYCPRLLAEAGPQGRKSQIEELINTAQAFQPVLMIVDTLGRSTSGSDEGIANMGLAISTLQRVLMEWPCHIHVVHHPGKDDTRGARGGSNLLGDVETMMVLQEQNEEGTLVTLRCEKQRDSQRFPPIYLERIVVSILGQDQYGKSLSSCAFREAQRVVIVESLSDTAQEIFEYLTEEPKEPAEIQRFLEISKGAFDKARKNLSQHRLIRKVGKRWEKV